MNISGCPPCSVCYRGVPLQLQTYQTFMFHALHISKWSYITVYTGLSCTMDNILLTWIGNAVYYALKLVTQSLLRDVTMIYGTKLRKLC